MQYGSTNEPKPTPIEQSAGRLAKAISGIPVGTAYGGPVQVSDMAIAEVRKILLEFAEIVQKEAEEAVWEKLRNYGPPPRY